MLNPLETIPDVEPSEIIQGDSLTWKRTDLSTEFPNTDYTLSYNFVSRSPSAAFSITAAADGSDYLISVAKAITAAYTASDQRRGQSGYEWAAFMTKSTGERVRVDYGTLNLAVNLATAAAGYDGRSHAKKMLDAITAVLEGRATESDLEYEINGRRMRRMSHQELIKAQAFYRVQYQNELNAEKIRNGQGTGRRILTRFGRPAYRLNSGSGPWV